MSGCSTAAVMTAYELLPLNIPATLTQREKRASIATVFRGGLGQRTIHRPIFIVNELRNGRPLLLEGVWPLIENAGALVTPGSLLAFLALC